MRKNFLFAIITASTSLTIFAAELQIPMHMTNESQTLVGTVTASDTQYGLMLTPHLSGLTPGMAPGVHGFHIHVNPSCASGGMAAAGHLDPQKSQQHMGPYASHGHLGDLPAVYVNADGSMNLPVVAPRLKLKDILGHSLMIHNGSDNYSDQPAQLGGGGQRMVCGVIPASISKTN